MTRVKSARRTNELESSQINQCVHIQHVFRRTHCVSITSVQRQHNVRNVPATILQLTGPRMNCQHRSQHRVSVNLQRQHIVSTTCRLSAQCQHCVRTICRVSSLCEFCVSTCVGQSVMCECDVSVPVCECRHQLQCQRGVSVNVQ